MEAGVAYSFESVVVDEGVGLVEDPDAVEVSPLPNRLLSYLLCCVLLRCLVTCRPMLILYYPLVLSS
jgi:hypothetical protein